MTTEHEPATLPAPTMSSAPAPAAPPSVSPSAPRTTTIDTTVHVTTAEAGATVVGMAVQNMTITDEHAYNVSGANPYLGLRSFGYDDRAKYAGREQIIAEAVA
jgi:hypothetical protein